jgi:Uma2 family endonuclease
MQHAKVVYWSEQDYLQAERNGALRHEYVAGYIYAHAGAGKAHNIIALNIASFLRTHLRGSPCRTFIADMKVRVKNAKAYYYPDIAVSCSPLDIANDSPRDFLVAPRVIVEVLSESSEIIDRREKMRAYFQLESLQEYVLVDSRRLKVEVFRRSDNSEYAVDIAGSEDTVTLQSLDIAIDMNAIYEDAALVQDEVVE